MNRRFVILVLMLAGAGIALSGRNSPHSPARGLAAPAHPTYSHDVASILYDHCVQCHQPGGSGPMSLVTYEEARRYAHRIAVATGKGAMPPWLPDPSAVTFADQLRLSDREIAISNNVGGVKYF